MVVVVVMCVSDGVYTLFLSHQMIMCVMMMMMMMMCCE